MNDATDVAEGSALAGKMTNKVALVTGAARGMGAEHARLLATEGARVVVADVLDAEAEAVASELVAAGHHAEAVSLDVSSAEAWSLTIEGITMRHGRLDVLVNNAGVGGSVGGLVDCTDEAWGRTLAVNQAGVFFGMRAVIPAMKQTGGGSIVNVSSIYGGVRPIPNSFAYGTTKAAVHYMTQSAAMAYGPDGIRVNAIAPGAVDTVMLRNELEREGIEIGVLNAIVPLRRVASSEEVSKTVLFLASDDSSYVTGVLIPVDGGVALGMQSMG